MKLGHVALLCKGWYKYRGHNRLDLFWMDMAHAISADGWSPNCKNDVARWCLHRLDELRKDEKFIHQNQLELSYIFDQIKDQQRRATWYDNFQLSTDDAIIWVFRDYN